MFRIGTHEIIHSYTPYSKSLYKAACPLTLAVGIGGGEPYWAERPRDISVKDARDAA